MSKQTECYQADVSLNSAYSVKHHISAQASFVYSLLARWPLAVWMGTNDGKFCCAIKFLQSTQSDTSDFFQPQTGPLKLRGGDRRLLSRESFISAFGRENTWCILPTFTSPPPEITACYRYSSSAPLSATSMLSEDSAPVILFISSASLLLLRRSAKLVTSSRRNWT
ncbi:hypothetical protein Q8A73_019487 [Channa argus]|nr:hypothetical protein Q8A73_019487 [Channa argus]